MSSLQETLHQSSLIELCFPLEQSLILHKTMLTEQDEEMLFITSIMSGGVAVLNTPLTRVSMAVHWASGPPPQTRKLGCSDTPILSPYHPSTLASKMPTSMFGLHIPSQKNCQDIFIHKGGIQLFICTFCIGHHWTTIL